MNVDLLEWGGVDYGCNYNLLIPSGLWEYKHTHTMNVDKHRRRSNVYECFEPACDQGIPWVNCTVVYGTYDKKITTKQDRK